MERTAWQAADAPAAGRTCCLRCRTGPAPRIGLAPTSCGRSTSSGCLLAAGWLWLKRKKKQKSWCRLGVAQQLEQSVQPAFTLQALQSSTA